MVCGRVSNLLSAYLDLELTGHEMLAVRQHLADCPACRSECEAIAQLRRMLGALPPVEPRSAPALADFQRGCPLGAAMRWPVLPETGRLAELLARLPRLPRFAARGAAWVGAVGLGLIAGLLVSGLRQPQHADTVVAMVRPDFAMIERPFYAPPPLPDPWPRERLEVPDPWPRPSPPAYRLIDLKRSRF